MAAPFDLLPHPPYLGRMPEPRTAEPQLLDTRLLERAADAVARARRAGADAAEASARSAFSTSLNVRLGELEDVERSEDSDLSLQVFIGTRSASVSTADSDVAALDALVERAVAMARIAPENPFAGLAPAELLHRGPLPDLDLCDPGAAPDPAAMLAIALEAEDAARAVEGVTNSEGGSFGAILARHAHVTSNGLAVAYGSTGFSISASVLAGEGEGMQRDYDYHSARHLADLEPAAAIGRRAGARAVARLSPGVLPSGRMPVVFDPRVAGSLIGHLVSAMSGGAIARGRSFLIGRDQASLFPQAFAIDENPLRPRGLRSHAVDGEGLPTRAGPIVADGRIRSWLCDMAAARQLGVAPTGHASGGGGVTTGNLSVRPGALSRDALIADIADGVLVTELIGQGVDMLTGDYSRGASGWRIVDGAIAGPVSGFTIAGNLLAMFGDLVAADDLDTRRSTHVPSLRTDAMTVAGD